MSGTVKFAAVAAVGEWRVVAGASALSLAGDMLAKAALTYLVFTRTGSVAWSAVTFAVGLVPWVAGGPVLSALAERYPFRRTMIGCDLVRAGLMSLVAVPGLPLLAVLALLFATSLFTPPFESARSALVAQILTGERYVAALAVQGVLTQVAQLAGYLAGGVIAAASPRLAIVVDAATFVVSALLVSRVRPRPSPMTTRHRSTLLREAAGGFSVVFGQPVLRAIALLVFGVATFAILPEGLAAAWTGQLGGGPLAQGVLMAASPVGGAAGGLVIARIVPRPVRLRLIRLLAVAAPALLVPALAAPAFAVVVVLAAASAFAAAGAVIACNGVFVQALPDAYRARAFGVMQGGLFVVQGTAVAAAGLVGQGVTVATVIGGWGLLGVVLMTAAALTWPAPGDIAAACERGQP